MTEQVKENVFPTGEPLEKIRQIVLGNAIGSAVAAELDKVYNERLVAVAETKIKEGIVVSEDTIEVDARAIATAIVAAAAEEAAVFAALVEGLPASDDAPRTPEQDALKKRLNRAGEEAKEKANAAFDEQVAQAQKTSVAKPTGEAKGE